MFSSCLARFGAALLVGSLFVCASVSFVSAASTIVQNDLTAAVGACLGGGTGCSGPSSFGFANPAISVQYRGSVNDSNGQVIPPGGSVSCGQTITFACDKHENDDISWFTSGGIFDSPYGTWNGTSVSCTDQYYVGDDRSGQGWGTIYANLSFPYPSQRVSGTSQLANCTTLADGCSVQCTAVNTGAAPINIPASFDFGSIDGTFYGALTPGLSKTCRVSGKMLVKQVDPVAYDHVTTTQGWFWHYFELSKTILPVTIPTASINYPITVSPNPGGGPSCAPSTTQPPTTTTTPLPPTNPLSLTAGPGTAACTIGTPYAITMSASGAQGTQVRYLIDWNNDGLADQIVPPSGYLPLGTPQQATRTYTTNGSKTVAVKAQDSSGNETTWTSFSFQCNPGDSSGGNQGDNGNGNSNDNGNGNGTPIQTDLTISVVPSLVGRGETTKVNWSSTNMASCSVQGSNGDHWPTDPSDTALESPIGGEVSSSIGQHTSYVLSCMGLDGVEKQKSASVDIVPIFNEQ